LTWVNFDEFLSIPFARLQRRNRGQAAIVGEGIHGSLGDGAIETGEV
jgi:hypothetical protein